MLVYKSLILAAKGETERFMVRYHQSEQIYCHMRLVNIDFLRPLIILLIVVNHVFAIYAGVWESPWENAENVEIYKWIQRVAICCSLQLFTFISGYIYAFQVKRGGIQSFKQLI